MLDYGKWEPMSAEDHEIIVKQLDRRPRGVLGIAARCSYGFPQVIVNRPMSTKMEDVSVFPTLFWLTCPFLRRRVGSLESEGWIGRFQAMTGEDESFYRQLEAEHERYAAMRTSLVPDEVLRTFKKEYPKRYKVLTLSGVGGIRNRNGVKCLHCHVADHLGRGQNVIGAKVMDMLDHVTSCSSGDCGQERE